MIFNDLCKITEKRVLETYNDDFKILSQAMLFEFESIFNDKTEYKSDSDNFGDYWYLPFPVTCIYNSEISYDRLNYTPESMCVFINYDNCVGVDCGWQFIYFIKSIGLRELPDHYLYFKGLINNFDISEEKGIFCDTKIENIYAIRSSNYAVLDVSNIKENDPDFETIKAYTREFMQSMYKVLSLIFKMNQIKNIIIESKNRRDIKSRKGKLLRKHERPEYVVVKSKEVRRYMGLPEYFTDAKTGRKKPYPHPVKAHLRTLNRGTEYERITHIPAYHTGERESIKGNRKYRVLLDREDFK